MPRYEVYPAANLALCCARHQQSPTHVVSLAVWWCLLAGDRCWRPFQSHFLMSLAQVCDLGLSLTLPENRSLVSGMHKGVQVVGSTLAGTADIVLDGEEVSNCIESCCMLQSQTWRLQNSFAAQQDPLSMPDMPIWMVQRFEPYALWSSSELTPMLANPSAADQHQPVQHAAVTNSICSHNLSLTMGAPCFVRLRRCCHVCGP
jgi:hypothetical protein